MNRNKTKHTITKGRSLFVFYATFALITSALHLAGEEKTIPEDQKLLNDYYNSYGYNVSIHFDHSNIKQYWIDPTVYDNRSLINVSLNDVENNSFCSKKLPIKLANLDFNKDCKIEIVSLENDFTFSVLNGSKVLSKSKIENHFINYNIFSATFHLCDCTDYSFQIQFNSNRLKSIPINKIVLSFSDNNETFLSSGSLSMSDNKQFSPQTNKESSDKPVSLSGKNTSVISNYKMILSNHPIHFNISLRNSGTTPTQIYIGYVPYDSYGHNLKASNYPSSGDQQNISIQSIDSSNQTVVLKSDVVPKPGLVLACDAKQDFSDIPNLNLLPGTISSIKQLEDSLFEVKMSKPFDPVPAVGSFVRLHPSSGTYPYLYSKKVDVNEEVDLEFEIDVDQSSKVFSLTKLPKSVFCISPLILSYSVNNEINTIEIKEYKVSFK